MDGLTISPTLIPSSMMSPRRTSLRATTCR